MKLLKKIMKLFFLLIILRIIFIDVDTPFSRCAERITETNDCYDAEGETFWRWRFSGNEIKDTFSFKSHGYTECSWFGSEIWIDEYTKDDGTEVDGYYRKRPSCW